MLYLVHIHYSRWVEKTIKLYPFFYLYIEYMPLLLSYTHTVRYIYGGLYIFIVECIYTMDVFIAYATKDPVLCSVDNKIEKDLV